MSAPTGGGGQGGGAAYAPTHVGGPGPGGEPSGEQQPPQPHQPPQAYTPPVPPTAAPQQPGYGPPAGYQATQQQPQAQPQQPHAQHGHTSPGVQVQGTRQPRPAARPAPRTRKARLRVAKADPWSVMKVSFLLSIALGVCTIVAVAVLWMVLDAVGVFETVGNTITDATDSGAGKGFDLQEFLSLPRVLMFTSIIAVIDVVLATALATLGAFIYNLSAGFVGGIELTLAEDE